MSRTATKEVEFYTEGKLVQTVTDAETARFIGIYKDVYNKIQSFDIKSCLLPASREGFIRQAFQAKSHRLKIVCFKEYLPNVPEEFDAAHYECGILNTKTDKFERIDGGVQVLFYNLFCGHTK